MAEESPKKVLVKPKEWWRSKTLGANIVISIIAIVALVQDTYVLTPDQKSTVLLVGGVLNIFLRFITSRPIEGIKE